jgi:GT2 family glycosyltransferase
LSRLSERFDDSSEHAVSGRTVNLVRNNCYSEASQLMVDFFHDTYNANPKQAGFWTSNNLAMPKKGFQAVNGFDITFKKAAGEDRDLCDRWCHHGFGIVFAPEVIVYHAHVMGLGGFVKQHYNYGAGAFRFHRRRRERRNTRFSIEPLSFYVRLVCYPFLGGSPRKLSLSLLLTLSQVANAFGYFREWRNYYSRIPRSAV